MFCLKTIRDKTYHIVTHLFQAEPQDLLFGKTESQDLSFSILQATNAYKEDHFKVFADHDFFWRMCAFKMKHSVVTFYLTYTGVETEFSTLLFFKT